MGHVRKNIHDTKIVICGIVKDAMPGLAHNIVELEKLCALLNDYRIFIYENNSTDNTKQELIKWQSTDPTRIKVSLNNNIPEDICISESGNANVNPFFSMKRISKMVGLRNKYMEYIDALDFDADYLMVIDLDVSKIWYENILIALAVNEPWDAIAANGYSLSPRLKRRYHDTYALVECSKESEPQTEKYISQMSSTMAKICENSKALIPVLSAFGGLTLYNYKAVKGLKYQLISNSDARVEVRCEHYSIYEQMRKRGYDKIFVCPDLKLKYQATTPMFIIKKIIERFKS